MSLTRSLKGRLVEIEDIKERLDRFLMAELTRVLAEPPAEPSFDQRTAREQERLNMLIAEERRIKQMLEATKPNSGEKRA